MRLKTSGEFIRRGKNGFRPFGECLGAFDIRVGFAEPRRDDCNKLKASRFKANQICADASYNYFSRRQKKPQESGLEIIAFM